VRERNVCRAPRGGGCIGGGKHEALKVDASWGVKNIGKGLEDARVTVDTGVSWVGARRQEVKRRQPKAGEPGCQRGPCSMSGFVHSRGTDRASEGGNAGLELNGALCTTGGPKKARGALRIRYTAGRRTRWRS